MGNTFVQGCVFCFMGVGHPARSVCRLVDEAGVGAARFSLAKKVGGWCSCVAPACSLQFANGGLGFTTGATFRFWNAVPPVAGAQSADMVPKNQEEVRFVVHSQSSVGWIASSMTSDQDAN